MDYHTDETFIKESFAAPSGTPKKELGTIPMVNLEFDAGSILLSGPRDELEPVLPIVTYDERIQAYRSCANNYWEIRKTLNAAKTSVNDNVAACGRFNCTLSTCLTLRSYQNEALDAWEKCDFRGVIVLPTGVGKSIVGIEAVARTNVRALIVLPTIDLMNQWASLLEKYFNHKIGRLGGGCKELENLTVSTYDSASILMEFIGNRFGLIIFDECHHLPGQVNRCAAEMACAPYRLGLTATPEREDGAEQVIYQLVGPIVYRREIDEFETNTLAPYCTQRLQVPLDADEYEHYKHNRQIYKSFLAKYTIQLGGKYGWSNFLRSCATAPDGREAMAAYQKQKRIAAGGRQKLNRIWSLLKKHAGERTIIFTALNELAYEIGEQFLLPVLTHLTKGVERKEFLDKFRDGVYNVLVTSRVLNEGIDIPEVSVGIIVSGSGSVREHVQRLGRLLRPKEGKQAVLYELISSGTAEFYISENRRRHRAYQRPSSISYSTKSYKTRLHNGH